MRPSPPGSPSHPEERLPLLEKNGRGPSKHSNFSPPKARWIRESTRPDFDAFDERFEDLSYDWPFHLSPNSILLICILLLAACGCCGYHIYFVSLPSNRSNIKKIARWAQEWNEISLMIQVFVSLPVMVWMLFIQIFLYVSPKFCRKMLSYFLVYLLAAVSGLLSCASTGLTAIFSMMVALSAKFSSNSVSIDILFPLMNSFAFVLATLASNKIYNSIE